MLIRCTLSGMATKSERWNLRVTPAQDTIVRRVLDATGMSLNEYVVTRTVAAATNDLADRRIFVLDSQAWDELQEILDRAPRAESRCRRSAGATVDARRRVSGYHGPTLLAADHVTAGFECGDETLDDWLKRVAPRNQREGSSRTWVVTDGARVVAYYASSAAVLTRAAATGRAARNQPDPLPAMLLGRLAVDHEHQGRGLAAALLKHFLLKVVEVAAHTGVRIAPRARRQRHGRELLPTVRLRTLAARRPDPHAPRQGHHDLNSHLALPPRRQSARSASTHAQPARTRSPVWSQGWTGAA